MKNKRSLKKRLLMICIVIITTSLLLCTFTIILVRDVLIKDLEKHNESLLELANNGIENYIQVPLNQLELTLESLNDDSIDEFLEIFLKTYPIISNLYIVGEDATIRNVYPYNNQAFNWNFIYEPSYLNAEENSWNLSQTYVSRVTNDTVISASKRINDQIVIAELLLNDVPIEIQSQNLFGEYIEVEVLDKWGTYIISSDAAKVSGRYRMPRFDDIKNNHSAGRHTIEDETLLFEYNQIMSWYVLVNFDQHAIERSIVDWFLIIILVWSVFSIVLVYSIISYFTQSRSDIEALGDHAKNVSVGNYDLVKYELNFTEFQVLDDQLKKMASIISERTQEVISVNINLERIVDERTFELNKANLKLKEEIAEREMVEEQIRIINYSLDKKVKERTVELEKMNDELNRSMEDVKKANEAKSKFLAVMSHEMRTPLNGIIGFTHMLSLDIKDPDQRKTLELVLSSSKVLLTLINDVLDVSKYEAGQMKYEKAPFNYKVEVEEVLDSFEVLSESKGLEFLVSGSEMIDVDVIGDPTKVKQVFYNLLNNSIKFTSKGYISVEFNCKEYNSNYIIDVVISDTGIGMEDVGHQMFEPFTQANDSIHRTYGGTGLGLTITKEILNHMHGVIEFSSDMSVGTKCHFTMKLRKNNQIDSVDKSYKNILYVEDHIVNQTLMTRFFEKYDIPFDLAENGMEAVELFKQNNYDLVLMDCQMPIMNGFDATRRIREMDKEIEIVAMTAYTTAEDRNKCIEAGMNDFMSKPINFKTLKNLIDISETEEVVVDEKPTDVIGIYAENLKIEIGFEIQVCRELIETFFSQLVEALNEIEVLKTQNDYNQIQRVLHQLKGSSSTVRLEKINNIIATSEELMWKGHYDKSLELIETIKSEELIVKKIYDKTSKNQQ